MNSQLNSDKGMDEGAGSSITRTFIHVLHRIPEGVMWLGGSFLIAVILLTVSDSFGRYFLNSPIIGSMEIVQLLMVVITFSGMVYVAYKEGNVKVDILVSHFPVRVQRVLTYIMTLVGTVAFALVSWQLWLAAQKGMRIHEESAALDIPFAPFKFAAAVGAGLICLLLLKSLLGSLVKRR